MEEQPTDADPKNRRRWDRHDFERQFTIAVGDKKITGTSRDVSLSGVFLALQAVPPWLCKGAEGVVILAVAGREEQFPFQVTRVTTKGVAVNLFGKEALFGMALTSEIFQELKDGRRR